MGPKRKRRRLPLLGATGAATGASDSGGLDGGVPQVVPGAEQRGLPRPGPRRLLAVAGRRRRGEGDDGPPGEHRRPGHEGRLRRLPGLGPRRRRQGQPRHAREHVQPPGTAGDHRRRVVGGERELSMGDGDGVVFVGSDDAAVKEDGEGAMASSSSSSKMRVPRGPHLQTLSIYLSLIYQRMT
uniref:Uncharacterized protein n=1 Tax=Setaria viridis TaxID=4556 RepID=A0A4U6TVI2_SETVI|nr:hypothetical protein SEVIR_8G198800v2 [Setaria viridis]